MFTVCLGFRDWHVEHLRRCLQSLSAFDVDVVVVDLGSQSATDVRDAVMEPSGRANFTLVRHVHREWSRSVALNFASRFSGPTTTHFVFTDADMIFPSRWIDSARAMVLQSPKALWLTDSRDLHERSALPVAPYDEDRLRAVTTWHTRAGMGAAMIVPRRWFRKVRGFDETYRTWGCEDTDLVERAARELHVAWLEGAFVVHQWHRRDWPTSEQFEHVKENRAYLRAMQTAFPFQVVRNLTGGWHGEIHDRGEVTCMSETDKKPEGEQAEEEKKPENGGTSGEGETKPAEETQQAP